MPPSLYLFHHISFYFTPVVFRAAQYGCRHLIIPTSSYSHAERSVGTAAGVGKCFLVERRPVRLSWMVDGRGRSCPSAAESRA
jgi:hypothetical protein